MLAAVATFALLLAAPELERPVAPCDVALRSEGVDPAAFETEAALRLPAVQWRAAGSQPLVACVDQLHAYVELRPTSEDRWQLTLILSDGRAWYRTVEAPEQAPRALASALANLLVAIEDADVEPDARDVELPAELAAAEVARAPVEPEPEPASEPEPAPLEPEPEPEPAMVLELGPWVGGAAILGLAPGPGLRAGAGGLGLDLRLPDALALGLAVRVGSRSIGDVSLRRTRVGVGLGLSPRRGRFEIPILFAVTVEGWRLRQQGSVVALGQRPLLGGAFRAAPSVVIDTGPVALRLGLGVDLGLSFEAQAGATSAAISLVSGEDPIMRVGGVELAVAAELGVWIPLRAPVRRRVKARAAAARRRPTAPTPAAPTA